MLALVDNYDSFTWNLVQYLGDLGAQVEVWRNDAISAKDLLARQPDGIVISPGPSDPDHAGICLDVIAAAAETRTPLLGVCLGHQAIGQAFGGKVIRAPQAIHGKLSDITHEARGLFAGLPLPCTVTRYHSLIVERETLPNTLTVTAETPDGLIMGLEHRDLPIHGVQFHPESIATQGGHALLANFLRLLHE